MKIFFAKNKKAGAVCAVLSALLLFASLAACNYTIGNIRCGIDSPILISDGGNAFFIGYYLIAAVYAAIASVSLFLSVILFLNALKVLKNK